MHWSQNPFFLNNQEVRKKVLGRPEGENFIWNLEKKSQNAFFSIYSAPPFIFYVNNSIGNVYFWTSMIEFSKTLFFYCNGRNVNQTP